MFCECRDILVCCDRTVMLDVEHLVIPDGRITAVVGLNGAGKTTLLEVIALLRQPDSGEMRLWGRIATVADRLLRDQVVMVMHPGYLFGDSVWHNLLYGLKARGVRGRQADRRAYEALRAVGMETFARRSAAHLSAGERQRVNLARAIAIQPRAILLDEPTANVDSRTVEVICDLLRWLRCEQGTTIVHTSPADSELMGITDKVIELSRGQVAHSDEAPASPAAASPLEMKRV